jgi:hypothetical protein
MAITAGIVTLFPTLTANGSTAPVISTIAGAMEVDIFVQDTAAFGGGTLRLQQSPDLGVTWLDVPGASYTAGAGRLTAAGPVLVIGGSQLRMTVGSAVSPVLTLQIAVRRVEFRQVFSGSLTANGIVGPFYLTQLPANVGSMIYGTFGGGNVRLQVSEDGGTTWYTVTTKTANDYTRVDSTRSGLYQFVLAGATTPALTCALL